MKILLWPNYMTMESALGLAPIFARLVKEHSIALEAVAWDGKLETLPTQEKCIVRASSRLRYDWKDLKEECDRLGHFCFYNDHTIGSDGEKSSEAFAPAVIEFFSRCKLIS